MNLLDYLPNSMSFETYKTLISDLLAEGKTTGANQSEAQLKYAKLNWQRLTRVEKTTVLSEEMQTTLSNLNNQYVWLIITEGWCGDAAQNVPVLEKIAQASNGKITTHYVLRDENLELIDAYLTNGGRAIPKMICFEPQSGKEVFVWGPRPTHAQTWLMEAKHSGMPTEQIYEDIHKWYAKDKGLSLQHEIANLLTVAENEMNVVKA